jgi:hypothetical protein
MLSVNYISNFLSDKQNKIDPSFYYRINEFEKKIDKNQDDIHALNYLKFGLVNEN